MTTKLTIKGDAANPEKWSEDFLEKVAAAGDHGFFTQQIFRKWWKKGLDDVFKGGGAQLELSIDPAAFTWTVKTLTEAGKKALAADKELAEIATHKGKCSGYAPKVVATPTAKPVVQPEPTQPTVKKKPTISGNDIKEAVRTTRPVGGKDDADKYTERMKRVLVDEFDGFTDKHLEAVKALANHVWFAKTEEVATTTKTTKVAPTLTAQQIVAVDAAMRTAIAAANGPTKLLDNDAQVAMGDAITAAFGGKYPTHSRNGGHKGSFNQTKTIQQQLSNIADKLTGDVCLALDTHLRTNWPPYSV